MTETPRSRPGYLPLEVARIDIDESNQAFWDACRHHEFVIQHCEGCERFQHPPRARCSHCLGTNLAWKPVSGEGTIFTYVITRHSLRGLEAYTPYNAVVVTLDDARVRFVSNLVDATPEQVEIGARVELVWEDVSEEFSIPRFRLAESAG